MSEAPRLRIMACGRDSEPEPRVRRVLDYHERTKHHLARYASGPHGLDWANQPDPFRTYAGAPRLELPLAADGVETAYADLYARDAVPPARLDRASLGAFLELALGLTAWKQLGASRWALRADPSSGNLHPTEGYLVVGDAPDVPAGVHHYVSRDHVLEQRCALSAIELATYVPPGSFLAGVSSIHWREAWKYGERAFRYCQHDAGHVLATMRFAAAALGWSARLCDGFGDERVARLLGLDRAGDAIDELDRETPEFVLLVGPRAGADGARGLEERADELVALVARGTWRGAPNRLSPAHVRWSVIDEVARATVREPGASSFPHLPDPAHPVELARGAGEARAATIVRRRRSAVALDGRTSLPREAFFALLAKLLPSAGCAPWDALPFEPRLHLALFVHRVDDLAPGLYLLERSEAAHAALLAEIGSEAAWTRPPGCPDDLRLFALGLGDTRRAAGTASCHQAIAADGAFSLGMLADFRGPIEADPSVYRRLFWEAGVIGQVLYLEAEAHGVRGTGIGCYFDDAVHELVGLESDRFQSLYHFTLGGPVDDPRLVTRPPYEHLGEHLGARQAFVRSGNQTP